MNVLQQYFSNLKINIFLFQVIILTFSVPLEDGEELLAGKSNQDTICMAKQLAAELQVVDR